MSYFEIVLISIGLCFDTLAVSMAQGCGCNKLNKFQRLYVESTFGFTQGFLLLIGWFLGAAFLKYIEQYDHWVAFGILLVIGGKMIIDYFKPSEDKKPMNLLSFGPLIIAAVATSIDAFTIGISMAMAASFSTLKIILSFLIVETITFIAAAVGLKCGSALSKYLGNKTSLLGGIILISIGVKTLFEHLLA